MRTSVPDGVTLEDLEADPHSVLARLRQEEGPVCWVPALQAWLVTGYDLAVEVMRDAGTFTVDDPRFATARVVGPSMLSLDGDLHARHRNPFSQAFRPAEVHARLARYTRAEAERLVSAIQPLGAAELRRAVAGPLAVSVVGEVLGLASTDPATILAWYDGIVTATTAQAGNPGRDVDTAAFDELAASLRAVIGAEPGTSLLADAAAKLTEAEAISNAAVLMFGGIETTEGMITNVMWHLLSHPLVLGRVTRDPALIAAAVEESLRLEPAAAVVDRYATTDVRIGAARIRAGDQVTVSLAGANRDPAVFTDPDAFNPDRANAGRQLAFARGPHFCLGAHLARLETRVAVELMLARLPGLRLDAGPTAPRGLVFRKPPELRVQWMGESGHGR
jgi:cytochrome P450